MASILDLLKAKGIDPTKLSSQQPSDDVISELQAPSAELPSATPTPGPTPSPITEDKSAGTPLSPEMLGLMTNPNSTPLIGKMDTTLSSQAKPEDNNSDDDNEPSSEIANLFSHNKSDNAAVAQKHALQSAVDGAQGFTNNTVQGLKDAQDKSAHDQAIDSVLRAVGNISGGLAGMGAHSAAPNQEANNKFYDNEDAQAKQGVADFTARGEQEKNDPTSAVSVQARQFAAPIMAKLGIKMPDNVSYNALEKLNPLLVKQLDAQEALQARHEDMALKYATLKQMKDTAKTTKASGDQDKALQSTQQLLESARGNPAAAQAEKDLYAAQKADSLFNRYKNPDQMNSAEVQLYATEIAKMASGGVPSIHELQGLNPATVPSDLSKVAQRYTNDPTSANAGAFLKRYKAYSDSLAQDARNVIQDKYGRVIESRKNMLGPSNYDALQANYVHRFDTSNAKNQSGNKIKVSNGQETLMIDPNDLDHATKDGYIQVN